MAFSSNRSCSEATNSFQQRNSIVQRTTPNVPQIPSAATTIRQINGNATNDQWLQKIWHPSSSGPLQAAGHDARASGAIRLPLFVTFRGYASGVKCQIVRMQFSGNVFLALLLFLTIFEALVIEYNIEYNVNVLWMMLHVVNLILSVA